MASDDRSQRAGLPNPGRGPDGKNDGPHCARVERQPHGASVIPPSDPDHWQNWLLPETLAMKPLIVGVIS